MTAAPRPTLQRQHDAPSAGFYNALPGSTPGPDGRYRSRHGKLTDKQRRTFLGQAVTRIQEEARTRAGRYLRQLDRIHASGCRTKQQRWNALATLAEPILRRLDLATLILGWLDADGQFRLNRQRGLAEDGALSDSCVSRTLSALEAAGYVRRKQRRLFKDGQRWITRTMIHIRRRFFIDLGLGHLLAEAYQRSRKRRNATLNSVQQRAMQARLAEAAKQQQKTAKRREFEARERRALDKAAQDATEQQARQAVGDFLSFRLANPDLSDAEVLARWRALNPS